MSIQLGKKRDFSKKLSKTLSTISRPRRTSISSCPILSSIPKLSPGLSLFKIRKRDPPAQRFRKSEPWIYQWGLKLEYALCAYHLGKSEEFRKTAQQLLAIESLPKETRAHILELFSANFSSHSGPCPKQGSS